VKISCQRRMNAVKRNKNDEFYTQLAEVEAEVKHYKEQLRGKTVYCNCDDPWNSNFFKYLALNFNELGLKKLIATGFRLPADGGNRPRPYVAEINEVPGRDDFADLFSADVDYLLKLKANKVVALHGDDEYAGGDFRSLECLKILKHSDVVISNPPFSLFRQYVAQITAFDKLFLIIGPVTAIRYLEFFKGIKDNKIWTGVCKPSGFIFQGDSKKLSFCTWFTNMGCPTRREEIPLYKKYTPEEYPKYDNFDAIEVSKTADIPLDYYGLMGVPITFARRHNPNQFDIRVVSGKVLLNGKNLFERIFIQRKK